MCRTLRSAGRSRAQDPIRLRPSALVLAMPAAGWCGQGTWQCLNSGYCHRTWRGTAECHAGLRGVYGADRAGRGPCGFPSTSWQFVRMTPPRSSVPVSHPTVWFGGRSRRALSSTRIARPARLKWTRPFGWTQISSSVLADARSVRAEVRAAPRRHPCRPGPPAGCVHRLARRVGGVHPVEDVVDDVFGCDPAYPEFGAEADAVGECGDGDGLDVVGEDVVAAGECGDEAPSRPRPGPLMASIPAETE
jgi:hypothetical protein